METGFVIQLIKSHRKQEEGMSNLICARQADLHQPENDRGLLEMERRCFPSCSVLFFLPLFFVASFLNVFII